MRNTTVSPRLVIATLALIVYSFLLPTKSSAQDLGLALYRAGYTRTIYVDCENHSIHHTGPFNPNAVLDSDRYGPAISAAAGSCGSLVGERANCEVVQEFVSRGFLQGLTRVECTLMDINDARLLTANGATAAFDDMERAVGIHTTPPITPPAVPPCAPTGGSTTSPTSPTPPTPCPVCPTCPLCPECQSIQPCLDKLAECEMDRIKLTFQVVSLKKELDECISTQQDIKIPAEVLETASLVTTTTFISPSLRNKLIRLKAYIELTDKLQPLPESITQTLTWLTSVSMLGRGRRQQVVAVRDWLEGLSTKKEK